ncbi:hypothetical protein [Pseudobacteroides cellulosolvens]|uniref:Uncharacterized protein n=1 Tax=Pseudobacteroides cellulosolvens ATCC 35603 = DSM 2933 TaxID=398512 RepID=A0A0L6JXG6_9FIRM|nr:hypothetical protein [Pseudobacteroides cellulosolvens]KNY30439.1 hypothetical protein Bccel_5719 [Pseudobacteroides cellulosolvens ATCC 35603 = DSM 2933]
MITEKQNAILSKMISIDPELKIRWDEKLAAPLPLRVYFRRHMKLRVKID